MTVKLLTEQHLEFLSLTRDCIGLSESIYVKCHIVRNHMSRLIFFLLRAQQSLILFGTNPLGAIFLPQNVEILFQNQPANKASLVAGQKRIEL